MKVCAMVDPDIWLGTTCCLESRQWAKGGDLHVVCFPVCHVYFFIGGGPKVYSQTRWGVPLLDFPPGSTTEYVYESVNLSLVIKPSLRLMVRYICLIDLFICYLF